MGRNPALGQGAKQPLAVHGCDGFIHHDGDRLAFQERLDVRRRRVDQPMPDDHLIRIGRDVDGNGDGHAESFNRAVSAATTASTVTW